MRNNQDLSFIISMERAALDHWDQSNPSSFHETTAKKH
jgi:hypothetical protein